MSKDLKAYIDSLAPPPEWLTNAWSVAKERVLDTLTFEEINAEIAAHRREAALRKGPQ